MSPTRRRRRRSRGGEAGAQEAGQAQPAPALPPLPQWRWRTFPVFFMFSLGIFVGLYTGLVVAATDNGTIETIVIFAAAGLLGLAFSRLATRFLMQRGTIKPRRVQRRR